MARLIERAIAEKRSIFDFLQGNEEYKYRLGGKDTRVLIATLTRQGS
jgi:CelD/BcsL family acetyltransferase involved in cellulose biosynthesis